MQTQQIVRGAAEVLTITRLAVDDVYKRVEASSYGGEPQLRYGVVTDVMDNGPDAAVVALEFRPPEFGGGVSVSTKVITGNAGLAIFPASPEEVAEHMQAMVEAANDAARKARDAYAQADALANRVRIVAGKVTDRQLTAPATSTEPLAELPEAED